MTKEEVLLKDGRKVACITLRNSKGMEVEVLTLGGILKSIKVPDKEGNIENILLEYEDINDYIENPGYINALIGRTAGRIHKGRFTLKGKHRQLSTNEGNHTLHGGTSGFDKKIWEAKDVSDANASAIELTYMSADGEEGYPGNLEVKVTYSLDEANALAICYEAVSDKDTLVNLTNHAYFNLSGNGKRDILEQELMIKGSAIGEIDEESIPTGVLLDVKEHSAFDFNIPKPIGKDINEEHVQLKLAKGYDHPWILSEEEVAVRLHDPISDRTMEVSTDQEAVVVYAMNYENPSLFTNGKERLVHYGICFETQALPIGHNECFKEGSVLKAKEKYLHKTIFKFNTDTHKTHK